MASAIYARALTHARYETSVAQDGRLAFEMLQAGWFDLVVADMIMPGMDGLELVRAMRADARLTRLPVLVLTGCTEQDMRYRGYRAGCDDYLLKPVRPPDLVERVKALLTRALDTGEQLSGAYLSGRLDGLPVPALLAFLHAQKRSGLLRMWRFGAYGEITLRQGQPLTAMVQGSLAGEEALATLLGWNAGTFRLERFDTSELEPELPDCFEELLAHAERRRLSG